MSETAAGAAFGGSDLAGSTSPGLPAGSGLDARPTVLVPTGSTEQHGPHLPLATDTVVAAAVAHAVADRLNSSEPELEPGRRTEANRGGDTDAGTGGVGSVAPPVRVVVAPALPYGASGEHQAFAGTISIGHDALRIVLIELVRSLSTWAGRIVFVNGHGGNVGSLDAAVAQLIAEGHPVSWVACAAPTALAPAAAYDSHAGRTETSLLLHLQPASVDLQRAEPGNTASLVHLLAAMRSGGVAAVSPNGVLGDPTGATAAEGAALFAAIVDEVAARIVAGETDARGRLLARPDAARSTSGARSTPTPGGTPTPAGGPANDGRAR